MPDPSATPAVRVRGLTKIYRSFASRQQVHALTDVSLDVAPGEIFGLLGPNGAGKTTMVKILLSVVKATSGGALLYGRPVTQPDARRLIGYLPENHRFPEFLTAAQMLDGYARLAGVPATLRASRIDELLALVHLTAWRDTPLRKFSKGMMQRAGLAQALMNDPVLIFLDEPTDGVDPIGRREIRDLLVYLKDQGKTMFLNSHMLSEVEQVCTRVAILHKGALKREGRVSELITEQQVYELQSTPLSAAQLKQWTGRVDLLPTPPNGGSLPRYRLTVDDRTAMNGMIDQLRNEGVEIEAIRPVRQSLEDFFIDVVQSDEGPTP